MELRDTNQRIVSLMTKSKEKGVCKGVAECKLLDTVKILQDMAYTVQGAFGFDGQAVMFQTSTGQINITRCGEDILKSVFFSEHGELHPVCNLVMKSVLDTRKQLGDGIKTYVILLNKLLNKCFYVRDTALVIKELCTFQTIYNSYFLHFDKPNIFDQKNMRKIVSNFFSTRFTESVSKTLSDTVSEWICRLSDLLYNGMPNFNKLIDSFPALCFHVVHSSTTNSTVRNGCLVKGTVIGKINSRSEKHILKVLLYSEETVSEERDIECSVRVIVEEIDGDSNILFVTNIILPDEIVFYLRTKGILILQGIDLHQTTFLHDYVLSNELAVDFKVENNFVWLNLNRTCQLVLCAPNSDLLSQYEKSVVDCLRLLKFVSNEYWLISSSGGEFEQKFACFLYDACSKSKMPLFCNRSDLIVWHKLLNESKLSTSNEITDSCQAVDEFVKNIVKNFINSTLDDRIVNIICGSMWEMSKLVCAKSSDPDKGDPVVLKLEILLRSIDMVIQLFRLNGIVYIKNKSSLL